MSTTFSGGYAPDDDRSFAVAVTMGESGWRVTDLGEQATDSLADAAEALRNLRSERAAVGLLNIDDDYFIIVRLGFRSLRVLLSDATAAVTDDIAADVFDELDLDIPDIDEDELDDVDAWAEGDMDILADLGVSEDILASICDDQSLWASEQIMAIAEEMGCAEELADVADLDYDGDDYDPYDD
ncbi:MAG: tRNA adenosine deaminase-associated protein [Corynebacterium sp.]|uniref:tRNA adenosine deaminase-associated protein n=1 Tax=Corynebacterium sp. TaxID=1720 RepID=UPI0026DAB025|nr:tRNA adenosine deaminase-associated protein [Corynebacterium sp.]MDO5030360.1 tRNA adenosine deaminase-associated protein [Corynebacterium sp.]